MAEDTTNSVSVRVPEWVLDEVEEKIKKTRRPRPSRGEMLTQAWRAYKAGGVVPKPEQPAPTELACPVCLSTLRVRGDNATLEVVREAVPKTGKTQLSATERALYEHIGRLSEKEHLWLERLLYILRRGDDDTRAAITQNLERFELLARVLNGEFIRGETGDPSRREQPIDPRLRRIRELAERHLGGGKTGGADEGRVEQQKTGDAKESPRKRRKQN